MYKILIAEDDPTLAKVMKKHIESWNMNVHCIKNFRNVIEEFREYEPHLVLLDIMLPFYNGYHWCTRDTKDFRCSDSIHIIGIRRYEYNNGCQYGRR